MSASKKYWRLKSSEFEKYEEIMLLADNIISADINSQITPHKLTINYASLNNKCREEFDLKESDKTTINDERDFLIREHEKLQDWGSHWDNLRWNVSKWFLSIQTVFLTGTVTGLAKLHDSIPKEILTYALILLSLFSMLLCYIWTMRNLGIHRWHRMAIRRQVMIELDPRIRLSNAYRLFSSVPEPVGIKSRKHSTGQLESHGPPLAFYFLWAFTLLMTYIFGTKELLLTFEYSDYKVFTIWIFVGIIFIIGSFFYIRGLRSVSKLPSILDRKA